MTCWWHVDDYMLMTCWWHKMYFHFSPRSSNQKVSKDEMRRKNILPSSGHVSHRNNQYWSAESIEKISNQNLNEHYLRSHRVPSFLGWAATLHPSLASDCWTPNSNGHQNGQNVNPFYNLGLLQRLSKKHQKARHHCTVQSSTCQKSHTWRRSKKQNLCDVIFLQASLKGLWSTHARLRSTPPRTCQGPWCSTYEERSTNHLIFLPQSNESETRRHESWGEQLVMPMHVHDIGKCWKCF